MDTTLQRDRAKRLFTYLKEFTLLKATPQRSNEHDTLLWLHALPAEKEIRNAAQLATPDGQDEWLIIRKPRFSLPPALPDDLREWVTSPLDDPQRPPVVKEQRIVTTTVKDDDLQPQTITVTLFLDQEPGLLRTWETFERTWQAWAKEERRALEVQGHYSRLFEMHQKLTAESEKYELRLGLGYLAWHAPGGYDVRRHLLTARAELKFDPLKGVLTVTASGDGARTILEQDMLDSDDRVGHAVSDTLTEQLMDSGEDLWSGASLPPVLEAWVNAASDRGTYDGSLTPPRGVTPYPVVHWAPALILRRRGERTLTATYDSIIAQLPSMASVPDGAARYLGAPVQAQHAPIPGRSAELVYFPLPANDAQLDIIRRIRSEDGVLVQGPPGTGKSHTIVNLVSHLLATDQKVLVTSHTARALSVLRSKFPAELMGLCVTHLRGEEGASATLEGSVSEILRRSTTRLPWREDEQEKLLHSQLEQARQEEDQLLDTLQQIRQAETDTLDLYGYLGTAEKIGKQLRAQEPAFEYLAEYGSVTTPAPLSDAQALRLLELLRQVSPEETAELKLTRPEFTALPSPEVFVRSGHAERTAQAEAAAFTQARGSGAYAVLAKVTSERRAALMAAVQSLTATVESERRRPATWVAGAVDDVLKEQSERWQELAARSAALLPELRKRAEWLEQSTPSGVEGYDPQTLRSDAQVVHDHLIAGGGWGNFLIRPAAVKTRLYLKDAVRIGGRPADTAAALQELLDYLRLMAQWQELRALWAGQGVEVRGPLRMQTAELDQHRRVIEGVLSGLQPLLRAAQASVQKVPGLPQPQWWEAAEVQALITSASAATADEDARIRKQALEESLPYLEGVRAAGGAHPVVDALVSAIQSRQPEAYGQAYLTLQALAERQLLVVERAQLTTTLRTGARALTEDLIRTPGDPAWDARLGALAAAWNWLRADERLRVLARPDAEVEMRERLAAVRQTARTTLGHLSATRAWRNTLNRMTHSEQSALVRWQQAVKRIGKGTGKHAGRHRKNAQSALNEVRTAIPAWIMPLYLVAESFAVTPGMFDVVIVDEASQAGPESLFLTFIAKKIIIVGDDKQVEPESVGVKLDDLEGLVSQYLYDFPAPEVISDPKSSLFGFGSYIYPGRLPLREHFRCMPEIIKFSSDLSYPDEPLIALRQFGAERLQPLVARHVEGGYTLDRKDKINPVEVRAIVDQIKACLANPWYAGKSMGVISLVGEAQATEINALLRAEVNEAEIVGRRIVCGDSRSFQGDERDVIFLSMVDSPSEGRREARRSRDNPTFQPRYNVAVSRARDQLWLFHSVDLGDLAPDDLRASLIRHVRHPELEGWQPLKAQDISTLRELAGRPGRGRTEAPRPFDSWFELDVYLQLVNRGYRVIPQYELNGYRIDLVVEGLRGRLAVECDGDHWHGPERYRDDLARQQTLERADMVFWRVRGSTFRRDPDAALDDLWATLDRRGVFPEGDLRNAAPTQKELAEPTSPPTPVVVPEEAAGLAQNASQDDFQETASEPVEVLPIPTIATALLAPYVPWNARVLPDPRTLTSLDPIIDGLREIIAAEGPMTARQAYGLYCQAAGVRFGQATKSMLNKAMTRALRSGTLQDQDEWGTPGLVDRIIRAPGTAAVQLREPGPRKLPDVPPSEVHALMQALIAENPELSEGSPDALFRMTLATYGAQRLTENVRVALERARIHTPPLLVAVSAARGE